MKIIGINASPRKKWNSDQMLDKCLEGAASCGWETEKYNLAELKFSGCLSCFGCKLLNGPSFGRCALNDELTPLLKKILEADAVVVSTPIYFGDVPGMVRNLFERIWFPGLLYSKEGKIAYDKKVKVGLIYTMNVGDASYYDGLINGHKGTFERFLGPTETLCATDTLQFSDYSKYSSSMFNEETKKKTHEEKFPADLQKAFELGKKLAE